MREPQRFDVVVVGGGFAGCVAARELSQAELRVGLAEARDRVGGRTWFQEQALAGLDLEMGGTWIDPRQTVAWAEAQRYGVTVGEALHGAPPVLWLKDGRRVSGLLPFSADELPGLERVIVAFNEAAARIDPDRELSSQGLADLDVSLDRFLATIDLPPGVREIAAMYFSAYGSAGPDDISALHLLRRTAAAGSVSEFVLSGASHPLARGTGAWLASILADSQAELMLQRPVHRIEQREQDVVIHTEAGPLLARGCVLAVPVNVWKTIEFSPGLGDQKMALAEEGLACRGAKVWALVDHVPADFSALGRRGGALQMVWRHPVDLSEGALLVGYGPDHDRLKVDDHRVVQTALREFLPDVEVLACAGHDWVADPLAMETWAVYRPGQIHRYERDMRRSEGRLVFAGADLAYRWPGFIDGALETGLRAARELLEMIAAPWERRAIST
jgi:monoamine oxidase